MGRMDRVCKACDLPIRDGEEWFRVHQDYVHRSCSEKYLKLAPARPKAEKNSEEALPPSDAS